VSSPRYNHRMRKNVASRRGRIIARRRNPKPSLAGSSPILRPPFNSVREVKVTEGENLEKARTAVTAQVLS
jgi:hypothetical protein